MAQVTLSLVIPAHNEAHSLARAVDAAAGALKGVPFEIIIAEDGSTDGTDKIAEALARKLSFVRHLHSAEKLGRGRALCRAFNVAKGKYVAYMDADLATNPKHLKEMVVLLANNDVVTGTRYSPESNSRRSAKRLALSKGFNVLVKTVLGSRLNDHQCGFKGFRREVALELCAKAREKHWFWDTEVLVLAQRRGLRIAEIPVEWKENEQKSKVNFRRDVVGMASAAVRMRTRKY